MVGITLTAFVILGLGLAWCRLVPREVDRLSQWATLATLLFVVGAVGAVLEALGWIPRV